jgi:cytochrome P450
VHIAPAIHEKGGASGWLPKSLLFWYIGVCALSRRLHTDRDDHHHEMRQIMVIKEAEQGAIPVIDADPYDLETLLNPHAMQEQVREAGRVVWIARHATYGIGRHEDVQAVLKDWKQFSSAAGAGLSDIRKPDAWRPPGPIVEVDPPRHTEIRATMNKIVSPQIVRSWRETFEREAESLCDSVLQNGTMDAVPSLAEAYVYKVFPGALGIEVNRENLLTIGNHNFNAIGPKNALFEETQRRLEAISAYFELNQTAEGMLPGGFGEAIFEAEAAGELPQGVASSMLRTLLRGGMDTTISGLGSTLWLLATNPEQWKLVRDNPQLVRGAFDEAIRLETPIHTYYRTTTNTEVDFASVRLKPETKVQLFLGAANRDPRKWENPARFDVNRKLSGHLGFGWGIHLCLGQVIARLEAECLLGSFVRRVARLEVEGAVQHRLLNALRTLDTLPLRITLA